MGTAYMEFKCSGRITSSFIMLLIQVMSQS
jgi:hypothetical protein